MNLLKKKFQKVSLTENSQDESTSNLSGIRALFPPKRTLTNNKLLGKDDVNNKGTKVSFDTKQPVVNTFQRNGGQILDDPLVNEFPDGMPRKRILHRELLQAYLDGDISMNELIDVRDKKSMHKISLIKPQQEQISLEKEETRQSKTQEFWKKIQSLKLKTPQRIDLENRQQTKLEDIQQIPSDKKLVKQEISPEKFQNDEKNTKRIGSMTFENILKKKDSQQQQQKITKGKSLFNSHLLSQFQDIQEDLVAQIKSGDLLQSDLSHKYYVKQFIETKNLSNLKLLSDKTSAIESQVGAKTVKQINQDFYLSKSKVFKEIEDAADDYLDSIQKRKSYSNQRQPKIEECEQLQQWRQLNAKQCFKQQKKRNRELFLQDKELKESLLQEKKDKMKKFKSDENFSNSIGSRPEQTSGGIQYYSSGNLLTANSQQQQQFPHSTSGQASHLLTLNNQQSQQIMSQNWTQATPQSTGRNFTRPFLSSRNTFQTLVSKSPSEKEQEPYFPKKRKLQIKKVTSLVQSDFTNMNSSKNANMSAYLNHNQDKYSFGGVSPLFITKSVNHQKLNDLLAKNSMNQSTKLGELRRSSQTAISNKDISTTANLSKAATTQANTFRKHAISFSQQSNSSNKQQAFQNSNYLQPQIQSSTPNLHAVKKLQPHEHEEEGGKEKLLQYLSNSKVIRALSELKKQTPFLQDFYEMTSQEDTYRNTSDLRKRAKIHAGDKKNLHSFYKSDYDYKIIKRNTKQKQSPMKSDEDQTKFKSESTFSLKSERIKSEGSFFSPTHIHQGALTNHFSRQPKFQEIEDEAPNQSESGDSSLPSITEAQLDNLYSQSKHLQNLILKEDNNPELIFRKLKSVLKLKEISKDINKTARLKLNHKENRKK